MSSSLKQIFRIVYKNKIFSFVNIMGLSIGLASAIIIFLYVEYELSFDGQYHEANQIYRITKTSEHAAGTDTDGATSYPLGYSLRNDLPDYEISTLYLLGFQDVLINEVVYREENILFVDSSFFSIFNFEWITGSPYLVDKEPKNIAITETLAKKYFGIENPVGKSLTFSPNQNFHIVGLLKDPPVNSSIQYSMVLSIDNLTEEIIGFGYDSWEVSITGFESYIKVPPVVNVDNLENTINEVVLSKYLINKNEASQVHYNLQPIKEVHLSPDYENLNGSYTTSTKSLWIFSFIGVLIITIAGINFINLSTAQGLKRAKEVGVRKVLGASKSQLSFLFIRENAFISFVAIILAVILVEVAIPYVNVFLGNNNELSIYQSSYFMLFFISIYLFVNIIIALYPSFVMTRFTPIKAIKGSLKNPKQSDFSLRNLLLVFQFVISISLIIATIVIKKQINFINNKDLGFKTENIMEFALPENDSIQIETLRNFLKSEPGVLHHGFGMGAPSASSNFRTSFHVEGEDENTRHYLNLKPVDSGYSKVFDIELLAGRWHVNRNRGDSLFELVVNEQLYKIHGFTDEFEALNKKIPFGGNNGIICGVLKDFHTYSLHNEIEATAFISAPQFYMQLYVAYEQSREKEIVARISEKMASIYPAYFLEKELVKDRLKEMYKEENRIATIITITSSLAIIIAVMGLFGLVSFMIVQKVNEIGIRKVLGASLKQIAMVLTKTYVKLILVASVIAIPLGWYFMNRWLSEFAYRINIELWVFVLATAIVLFIALLSILYQVLRTGRMNPVDALKYE